MKVIAYNALSVRSLRKTYVAHIYFCLFIALRCRATVDCFIVNALAIFAANPRSVGLAFVLTMKSSILAAVTLPESLFVSTPFSRPFFAPWR